MPTVVTINRAEVVALIESAANQYTAGNKTEVVALALRRLLEQDDRTGSLFGAHPGSVRVHAGTDLVAPALTDPVDAETAPWAGAVRTRAASSKGYRGTRPVGHSRR